jgi:dTDP-3-amino-3,4,6-trideoxy-alpha-D-glucose transaminase
MQNLAGQYHELQAEIDVAVQRVLGSGWYVLGKETLAFESAFAEWCEVAGCVGVNSGTDALQLALMACGIGPGDEVITVAHTAVATVAAIRLTGATPVLADINPRTFTIDPTDIARKITPRTKAIIPVHIYGQMADMDAILALVAGTDIRVIEDCAQAHGARYRGRMAGSMGDLGCFSFYPTKNLGAVGDGGAVIGSDAELLARVRSLREYGWTPTVRYVSQSEGINSRLDELQAAMLNVKLGRLHEWNQRRRELAAHYDEQLAGLVTTPHVAPDEEHVYHLYVVRTPQRDYLRTELAVRQISTGIHYPVPVHQQPAYRELFAGVTLPETEAAATEILSLPIHPGLTADDVVHVAAAIRAILA